MQAKSKAQQRLFGMALALRKGEMEPEDACKKVREIADSDITTKDIKKFAKTKCKKLPKHVTKEGTTYNVTEEQLTEMVHSGVKGFLIREGLIDDEFEEFENSIDPKVAEFLEEFQPEGVSCDGSKEEGGYTVTLKDRRSNFYICMDVCVRNEDIVCDWNQYIFNTSNSDDQFRSALQDDIEMFQLCESEAVYYLEKMGKLFQDNRGHWFYDKPVEVDPDE